MRRDVRRMTETEQFRHECEVDFVSKQTPAWIKTFLAGVKVKRGEPEWFRLRKDVINAWKWRKKRE